MGEKDMGQEPTGKASRLAGRIRERGPLGPGELWPERPQLRLRADMPLVEVSESTRVQDILGHLEGEATRRVLLGSPEVGATAVVVSVDRYIELVGAELEASHQSKIQLDGRIEPTGLAASDVEQVDSQATWVEVAGRKPS
jgi:hypothetical protein